MIADISSTFQEETLKRKIDYQISKIEDNVARELYNSSGDSLLDMYRNMTLVGSLNDRVKSPYVEFVLSSPPGEVLSDKQFIQIAQDYMARMGYAESCYSIIRNEDKEHQHVHIIATTIDMNGMWISDSQSRIRSGKIMRDLEKKYGIYQVEKGVSSHSCSLGESQYRQYFFDAAVHKALRSNNAHDRVEKILQQSDVYKGMDLKTGTFTNDEWKIILGEEVYEKALQVLSKGKFFNPLFKDELLSVMDRLDQECKNVKEFRDRLENEGYYMRMVSDKGKSHYVYGIPDRGFYLKDSVLPERYRFGNLKFDGRQMTSDEQKHYLYDQVFKVLNTSADYQDFKSRLLDNGIKLEEHSNNEKVYGVSFSLSNVEAPVSFKGSDISRRLTYLNLQKYFQKEPEKAIEPFITRYVEHPSWGKDISYMMPAVASLANMAVLGGTGKHRKEEDEELTKKKKKKRRGLSR